MLVMYLALIDNPTDREVFTQLYTEHRQSMFYFAKLILHDDGLAEDAVHDAFLSIATNMNCIDLTKDARNLLLTIVKNSAITTKSKRDREIYTYNSVGVDFEAYSYNLEDHFDNYAQISTILDIIDDMSFEYSTVFRLRYLHDMKYSDIANTLGITVAAAKKRIQRAKHHIEQILKQRDEHGEI